MLAEANGEHTKGVGLYLCPKKRSKTVPVSHVHVRLRRVELYLDYKRSLLHVHVHVCVVLASWNSVVHHVFVCIMSLRTIPTGHTNHIKRLFRAPVALAWPLMSKWWETKMSKSRSGSFSPKKEATWATASRPPPSRANKTAYSGLENQRKCHQKSKKGLSVAHKIACVHFQGVTSSIRHFENREKTRRQRSTCHHYAARYDTFADLTERGWGQKPHMYANKFHWNFIESMLKVGGLFQILVRFIRTSLELGR